nr:esterase E4-like [Leptinotarsa decemlineata]
MCLILCRTVQFRILHVLIQLFSRMPGWVVLLLLFTTVTTSLQYSEDQYPIVATKLGKIRGNITQSRLGRVIYSFRGIRYAKPPVNELRFQPPVPVEKWEGIYDATKDGMHCPQPRRFGSSSEDCLIVNVYTTQLPTTGKNPKRPVIIHIPSGRFFNGGSISTRLGPNYFMDQDIVLVTFNYRVASLGFLSTGDKYAPGNNGLKDQVELLKWVKNNIEDFGGDPNSVTITGYSAGGSSVVMHMVSPMSRGKLYRTVFRCPPLFHFSCRSIQKIKIRDNKIDAEKLLNCLKTVPAQRIGETLEDFREFGIDPSIVWGPVIEGDFGQSRFLSENPFKLIMEGHFQEVPFLVGQTKDELGNNALLDINNASLTRELNEEFERVAPIVFLYERNTSRSRYISRYVKSFYFHDKPIDRSQVENLTRAYSDPIVGFFNNRAAKLIARCGRKPVYYYCFTFQGRYSNLYLPKPDNISWVVHLDDLMYLLYDSVNFPLFGKDSPKPEVDMVEKLTTMYANFARTGNPTPHKTEVLENVQWEPFTPKCQKYLDIGKNLVVKQRLYQRRFEFWEYLFPLSIYQK